MAESIVSEIFRMLREDIVIAKNQGLESFTTDQLFSWVGRAEVNARPLEEPHEQETYDQEKERLKRDHDYKVEMTKWAEEVKHINASSLEHIKYQQAGQLEVFKGAIRFGEIALKSSLLVNGGAAVAFLAFIGTLWTGSKENPQSILHLAGPLMMFVWGVLFGAVSSGLAYLTQITYSEGSLRWGNILRVFTVLSVFGAYICFLMGAIEAGQIFSTPIIESVKEAVLQ